MAIIADYHIHSRFSFDGTDPAERLVRSALDKGLTHLCFTEHLDLDYQISPETPHGIAAPDMEAYGKEVQKLRQTWGERIDLGFGIELGMQTHLREENGKIAAGYPFDFIIASSHMLKGMDPFYFTQDDPRTDGELYRQYFENELACVESFDDFDVYGHLDYVVRFGRRKDQDYSFDRYADILIPILDALIAKGKGIELNTCGLRKGLRQMNPSREILKEYRHRGGRIVTVGSDAHAADDVAADFHLAEECLLQCGFDAYCTFSKREPVFHKLKG